MCMLFYQFRKRKFGKMLNHHWVKGRAFFCILVGGVDCIHFFLMMDLMLLVQFVNDTAFINVTIPVKREKERKRKNLEHKVIRLYINVWENIDISLHEYINEINFCKE